MARPGRLTALPVARIKKIVAADPDTGICSNNAAFAICVATESFIQYLVEQTHTVVKSELKPRRNIQYKDVGKLYRHAVETEGAVIDNAT